LDVNAVERRYITINLMKAKWETATERYLGLGYTDATLDLMLTLKARALRYGGDFTLLWHKPHLTTAQDRAFYRALVA
jgi:hypothetical protein